jgi:hypothetical protein
MLNVLVIIILSYLIGSFPTGVIAGRLVKKIDIREHGSGNTGATNSFRVLGWRVGLAVALIDMLKGAAVVLFIAPVRLFDAPVYPESVLFIRRYPRLGGGPRKAAFCPVSRRPGLRHRRWCGKRPGAHGLSRLSPGLFHYPRFYRLCLRLRRRGRCGPASHLLRAEPPHGTPIDPVILGFFIFAFAATLFGVRRKLMRYIRGEAELFEKAMVFRKKRH